MFKPTAILVALAGFAAGASAQSSVTIFGLVDLSLRNIHSGSLAALQGASKKELLDGTVYGPGSRWGIRVREDLGGGLAAGALLEGGFLADTGSLAQGGRGFGRQAYALLGSKDFGELRAGRQYIFDDEVQALTNPTIGTTAASPAAIFTLKTGTFGPFLSAPRIDNAVQYISPILGGFQVKAMVAASEGTQDRYRGLKGSYTSGPVDIQMAVEQSEALNLPPSGDRTVNKVFVGGGSYNFGAFKLWGAVERAKNLTTGLGTQIGTLTMPGLPTPATDLKSYDLSVSAPIGDAINLMAVYTNARFSTASGASTTVTRTGVNATYNLSKLTLLYATVAVAGGALKDYVNEKQVIQLGLRKAF